MACMEEDVVVSGMAGRFPECNSVAEFWEALETGKDLVTHDDRRWDTDADEKPVPTGKVPHIDRLDADYFGFNPHQVNFMDPQARGVLELTYETLFDAGVNPTSLRGARVGVFAGVCFNDSEQYWTAHPEEYNIWGLFGTMRALLANRISYAFHLTGPSESIDTLCSSSLYALDAAYESLKKGKCDAALVVGANLVLSPLLSVALKAMGATSTSGRCRTFDAAADGYVRSEALVVVLLQAASVAKRHYATVVGTAVNCDGFKAQSFAHPSRQVQGQLMREVYEQARVPLDEVAFIDCHGTGTAVGDPIEVNAVTDVFFPGRSTPLLIGSVKSNMGHAEGASGMCAMVKALLAMKYNKIPANIHYETPNPQIPGVLDGRLKVITENLPMIGKYVGLNGFGFGGSNAHVVLRRPGMEVMRSGNGPVRDPTMPWIVGVSGRTEEAVKLIMEQVKLDPGNSDTIALLHDFFSQNIPPHLYRGSIVVSPDGTNLTEVVHKCRVDARRPIWYIISGFGGQWPTMCHELLAIPTIRASIDTCNDALKQHNLDIYEILNNPDENAINQFKNGFVAWVAIQIALVDLLSLLGMKPDGIIGHSIGEVGSAYADGCLTARQAILAAYHRGEVFSRPEFGGGAMAAVGMSAEQAEKILPAGIEVGCDNGRNLVTLSGPAAEIRPFIETLRQDEVYVKEVNVNGVAFHSRHIAAAAPLLQELLSKVIPEPKERSERWISTSVDRQGGGDAALAKWCSAEYLVNNQMARVRFLDACAEIPPDALVVEIAPHAMMQSVLRDTLPVTAACVALLRRKEADVASLAKAIGRLYLSGAQPDLAALYPRPRFPVAESTPLMSHLVGWDHSKQWRVPRFTDKDSQEKTFFKFTIDINTEEDSWYKGHAVDGRVIMPATGYILLVWRALGQLYNVKYDQLPVTFHDLKFLQATLLPPYGEAELCVKLLGTGRIQFEVAERERVVFTGFVTAEKPAVPPPKTADATVTTEVETKAPTTQSEKETKVDTTTPPEMTAAASDEATTAQTQVNTASLSEEPVTIRNLVMEKDDVGTDMTLRGFKFTGLFRSITEMKGNRFTVNFAGNWATFLDGMLQMLGYFSLVEEIRKPFLILPTMIRHIAIDPKSLHVTDGQVYVYLDPVLKKVDCPGVSVSGLTLTQIERRPDPTRPLLEHMTFTPYHRSAPVTVDFTTALLIALQLFTENSPLSFDETRVAIFCDDAEMTLGVAECLRKMPGIAAELTHVTTDVTDELQATLGKTQVILATQVAECRVAIARSVDEKVRKAVQKDGYLILLTTSLEAGDDFKVLSSCTLSTDENLLLCVKLEDKEPVVEDCAKKGKDDKKGKAISKKMAVVRLDAEAGFDWLGELQGMLQEGEGEVLLVAEGRDDSGVVGLVNSLRLEPTQHRIRCVFVQDKSAPKFSLNEPFFAKQLDLGLTMNVYKQGSWGSYRHIPLNTIPPALTQSAFVSATLTGDLSSMRWIQGPPLQESPEEPNFKLFEVYYTALNFRDVLLASGQIVFNAKDPSLREGILGYEFSGRDSSGRRWMGASVGRGLATTVISEYGWEVPHDWTLEEAATVTMAYSTAYYSLMMRGNMKRGESVLIHAGSGGVGQAAITLALHMGCEVFTTVGSEEKRAFLKERFPQLDDSHIGHSRSTSFEELVMRMTAGRGVDLVLNSLADDKLLASVRCVATHGRFLEIGKADLLQDHPLGMSVFERNISFHGIAMDKLLFNSGNHPDIKIMKEAMMDGMQRGVIRPINTTIFDSDQVESAFRYMSVGKHIGKILVKVRDEERSSDGRSLVVPPAPHSVVATPRYTIPPGSVCVITGGLGGLGLELANWLVLRGARHLVLCSRTGEPRQGYKALCLLRWRAIGTVVHVSTRDVTTRGGAELMLDEAAEMGPVAAIFHLAAVLSDGLLQNQTVESFKRVWDIKMAATCHLDLVSRSRCPALDTFVLFSSAAAGRGNPGQCNYALASSAAERVVEARRAAGYPATAIQWGPVGEVGLAADLKFTNMASAAGIQHQSVRSCLAAMDTLLTSEHGVVASMVVVKQSAAAREGAEDAILTAISNMLGMEDLSSLPPETKLSDLGMDSLMQVEIRVGLERYRGITMSPEEIKQLTIAKVLSFVHEDADKRPAAAVAAAAASPEEQHESKVRVAEMFDLIQFDFSADTPIMPEETVICLASAADSLPPLFMIHPIDGSCASLRGVARHINRRVYGLQFTAQAPQTTVPDLAAFYIKHLRAKQAEGPYALVGYSFGTMIATEMAYQMERQGQAVAVIALDGLPQYKHLFADLIRVDYEVELLMRLAKQRMRHLGELQDLRVCLMNMVDWESRLDCGVGRGFMTEVERAAATAWLWRCQQMIEYKMAAGRPKLKTGVVIVGARSGTIRKHRGDEMFGFKPIVSGELEMMEMEGDHASFLLGDKHQAAVADIFNLGLALRH